MDFFRASELKKNLACAEELEKEKKNRQYFQEKENNSKAVMVKTWYLNGLDINNLLIWYEVPRKQWKNVEWKKNWWKFVKWDPPSYEKWTDKDEKKLQDLKIAGISLDDTAYGH